VATKIFLKQFQNSFSTATNYSYASLTASVLALTTGVTNKINGTTQVTSTAAGTALAWISPPIASPVTISGTITYNGWVKTSSTTGAPKTVGRVFKYSGGSESQISTKTSTLVQSTSIQVDNFTDTAPTSTAFAVGDRIVIKWFVASTSATGTETHDYSGKTAAADGDEWVQFTESITFNSEPELVQVGSLNTAGASNALLMPGNCAAGNLLVIESTWAPQSSTASLAGNSNTYTSIAGPTNWSGASFRSQFFYAANINSGATTITQTVTGSPTANFTNCCEYGGMAAAPFDATASSVATGNNNAPTSNASATTSANDELVVGLWDSAGTNSAAGTNFVFRKPTNSANIEDKFVTAVGAYTASLSLTGTAQWVMTVATFKAAFQDLSVTASGGSIAASGGSVTPTGTASITATGGSIAATGGTVTPTGTASVTATGASIATSGGSVTVAAGAIVTVTGGSITATGGQVTVTVPSGDITVNVTGQSLSATGGSVSVAGDANVPVTGQSITLSGGNVSVSGNANVTATGNVITVSFGTVTVRIITPGKVNYVDTGINNYVSQEIGVGIKST
jgi:hypothetical protein